jgi:glucose-1-phosphate cytidylyltransferase
VNVVILAGGQGTRLSEETAVIPKPMVEIGGKPLLWHIMNIYSAYGFHDFVIALGYRGDVIKNYFINFYHYQNDLHIDLRTGVVTVTPTSESNWRVHLIDTGLQTQTGGRVARMRRLLAGGTFMLTYGDGVGDVDITRLLAFHRQHGKLATVTAVRPVARFGEISVEGSRVVHFKEKPQTGEGLINGGFFVFEPGVLDYLDDDQTVLEGAPLERLAREGQLMAYRHEQFWQCMDTLRDKIFLERLWASGDAPWRVAALSSVDTPGRPIGPSR